MSNFMLIFFLPFEHCPSFDLKAWREGWSVVWFWPASSWAARYGSFHGSMCWIYSRSCGTSKHGGWLAWPFMSDHPASSFPFSVVSANSPLLVGFPYSSGSSFGYWSGEWLKFWLHFSVHLTHREHPFLTCRSPLCTPLSASYFCLILLSLCSNTEKINRFIS